MEKLPYPIARHFAPAEVEAITGVAVATLRDWKRRELIMPEAIKGWRKFPLGTLSLVAVLKAASDAGLAIKTMASWAPWWAGVVQAHVLNTPLAWENPYELADLKFFNRQFGSPQPGERFGVAIANGPYLLTDDVHRALSDHGGLSCVALDLHAIAAKIVERAGGPIAKLGSDSVADGADGSVNINLGPRPSLD
jgi:hypothetical protein